VNEVRYRSKFERLIADKLACFNELKYETHKFPYTLQRNYIPDFVDPNTKTIIEIKGFLRNFDERQKMLAIKEQYPDWTIAFVFMYPHKRVRGLKVTHKEWALSHGFQVLGLL